MHGGNVEIVAISEFMVPFSVCVVSEGPKNPSTTKCHLVMLLPKENKKQEMLSISEEVCFYKEPSKKHFLQTVDSLSVYCYSIKFCYHSTNVAIFPELFKLLRLNIDEEVGFNNSHGCFVSEQIIVQ